MRKDAFWKEVDALSRDAWFMLPKCVTKAGMAMRMSIRAQVPDHVPARLARFGTMPIDTPEGAARVLRPVDYVKKVGKGKNLSADLDPAEARAAFESLLAGGFAPSQLGAFLQALRI